MLFNIPISPLHSTTTIIIKNTLYWEHMIINTHCIESIWSSLYVFGGVTNTSILAMCSNSQFPFCFNQSFPSLLRGKNLFCQKNWCSLWALLREIIKFILRKIREECKVFGYARRVCMDRNNWRLLSWPSPFEGVPGRNERHQRYRSI